MGFIFLILPCKPTEHSKGRASLVDAISGSSGAEGAPRCGQGETGGYGIRRRAAAVPDGGIELLRPSGPHGVGTEVRALEDPAREEPGPPADDSDKRRILVALLAVSRAYVLAFFKQRLLGDPQPLLDGPSPDYPEATLTKQP